MIVTAATKQRLGAEFPTRRLCKVRVVNIGEPIELFELRADPDHDWQAVCKKYEQGLKQFEGATFRRPRARSASSWPTIPTTPRP